MPNPKNQPQPYHTYPGEAQQVKKRGRLGCWLGVGVLLVALISAGAAWQLGIFTPGKTYTTLSPENNAIAVMRAVERLGALTSEPEFTISAEPQDLTAGRFAVALDVVSREELADGNTRAADWVPRAHDRLHTYLTPETSLYIISAQGTPPETVLLSFNLEQAAQTRDLLDVYGWDNDAGQWRFLPFSLSADGRQITVRTNALLDGVALFRAEAPEPTVITRLGFNQSISPDVRQVVTIVTPVGMRPVLPGGDGQTLTGNLAPGFDSGAGYRVMPVIRNYQDPRANDATLIDSDTIVRLLNDDALRRDHIQQIVAFTGAGGYTGVFIDYQDIPAEQRESFSAFVQALGSALDNIGARLGVVLPAPQNIEGRWETGAYDWREIGQSADYLQINHALDPTLFTPGADRYTEAMLRWAVSAVERYKLIVLLPAQSTRERDGVFSLVGYGEALGALGALRVNASDNNALNNLLPGSEIRFRLDGLNALPGNDEIIQTPFIDYFNANGALESRVWLTTRRALRFRLDSLSMFGIGGIAFNDLLQPDLAEGIAEEILSYRAQLPQDTLITQDLRLRWRIEGAEGVVSELITGFNDEIVVTLQAPVGNYAVNVEVIDGENVGRRDSVAVALAAPTNPPTPLPFATQRPPATLTPTLIPVIPTADNTGPGVVGVTPLALFGAPGNPVAGSINLSGFEYGGHVTDMGNERAINAMRSAGMQWIKVQVRYSPNANLDNARRQIESGRRNGFKTLIGLVGNPRDVINGGEGYIRGFADFAAGVAALGADAIEVWNEPNLGREWPSGAISGANYTALLAQTFNAIKSVNPNVIVISGAPAPTGAQAAFPGDVVNDDVFLTEMVNAGALNFMDCLGVHYNEGVVSPTATSGDPRGDNYYTRYLPSLLNRYNAITGGRRPMCITELGYLSPEGFGSLPLSFAWASSMNNARHSAYLAEAISYASQLGYVRMVIVWNIDFTRYDSDPMGGYAIIRPDGSCPACATIAGAR